MKNNTFKDVNREDYLKALITDLTKQAHLSALPDRAKIIYDFVVNNPNNDDAGVTVDKFGMVIKEGCFLIRSRKAHKVC